MSTQKSIVALVNYLHDPGYLPRSVSGYRFCGNFSVFRRCTPVAVIAELEEREVWMDATLDEAGVSSHSVFTLEDTMPLYFNMRKGRIPPKFKRKAGEGHIITGTAHFEQSLICVDYAVTRHNNRWLVCDKNRAMIEGGKCGDEIAKIAAAIAGAAFNARYAAHMEFECGNGTSVALPVGLEQIKEILRDRDKPENGDRRPALIHLVRSHKRATLKNVDAVREHLRGRVLCHWRGWDVALHPPQYVKDRLQG
jgi:hypothetical protein